MDAKASARTISSSFRIIFTMSDFTQDLGIKTGIIRVTISEITRAIPIPCKEAISLDFPDVQASSKIIFTVEDPSENIVGWAESDLPDIIFESHETEINQSMRFYLNNSKDEYIIAKVYMIFLNKGVFKQKAKQITSKVSNYAKHRPASPDKKPANRKSSSPLKKIYPKSATKIDDAYLSAVIDNHSLQFKSVIDEHNALHNLVHQYKSSSALAPKIAVDSLHEYTPTKLTVTRTEITPRESLAFDNIYKPTTKSPGRIQSARTSIVRETEDFNSTEEPKRSSQHSARREPEELQFSRKRLEASMERLRSSAPEILSARNSLVTSEAKETYKEPEFGATKFFIGKAKEKGQSESTNYVSFCKKSSTDEFVASEKMGSEKEISNSGSKAEIEYLQSVIENLQGQLKGLQEKENENVQLKKELEESERARRNLQEDVVEKANCLERENSELRRQLAQMQGEKEELIQQNKSFNISFDNTSQIASDKDKTVLTKQTSAKTNETNDLKEELRSVRAALEKSETDRLEIQKNYRTSLEVFEKSLESTEKTMEKVAQEKRTAVIALGQCKQELNKEKLDHQETLDKLTVLRNQIAGIEHYKDLVKSMELQRDELQIKLLESKKGNRLGEGRYSEDESSLATKEGSEEIVRNLEVKNERLSKELNEARFKVSELVARNAGLEQVACVNNDIKLQLESTSSRLAKEKEEKEALRKRLEEAVNSQSQTHDKVFELEKSVGQMKTAVVEKDQKYTHIRKILMSMGKAGDLYIPQRNDHVDNVLADSLNLNEEFHKYRGMFIWEAPGNYRFGTKKLFVRADGGSIAVKVGGGFIKLEEFFEMYGPLEYEKANRGRSETPTKINGQNELRNSISKG